MSGTSKGWLGSKRIVHCGHCGKESRYDNLARHITKVHGKNASFKYNVIEPKDNVLTLLKSKEKIQTDNNNVEGDVADLSNKEES